MIDWLLLLKSWPFKLRTLFAWPRTSLFSWMSLAKAGITGGRVSSRLYHSSRFSEGKEAAAERPPTDWVAAFTYCDSPRARALWIILLISSALDVSKRDQKRRHRQQIRETGRFSGLSSCVVILPLQAVGLFTDDVLARLKEILFYVEFAAHDKHLF